MSGKKALGAQMETLIANLGGSPPEHPVPSKYVTAEQMERLIAAAGSAGGGGGGSVTVDAALSATSENPVQNKAVKAALDQKADSASIANKLDKAQGAANAGKFLVVGENGNVTLATLTAWQGGNY